jgi:septal ring factor EnvC (AmiA/AmiB activator)
MPLTQQIIKDIVKQEVKSELTEVKADIKSIYQRFDGVDQKFESINQKIDKLTEIVVDFAGQVKKFDEEQTVLSGQVSNITDRVEKLELAIN